MIRIAISVAFVAALASVGPASAETLYCSTWQGVRTCQGRGGYVSHETTWQGVRTGSDNRGNEWTATRWQGIETLTVKRRT
jgi:hypothetical protein